jgi:hypothetical protein
MSDNRTLTPREAMERERARLLAEAASKATEAAEAAATAAAIDRDMAEYDRIAAKYNVTESAPRSKQSIPTQLAAEASSGTVGALVEQYRNNELSPYKKIRFKTREYYDALIKRLLQDCGSLKLADLKTQDFQSLYDGWTENGTKKQAMGHSLITMLRGLVNFGMAGLADDQCERLAMVLHNMHFPMVKSSRSERLTAEQAMEICRAANEMGRASIALAQAFQFDCKLRQKDVIGEWVPLTESEQSDVIDTVNGNKWLRGIRWEGINENFILTHVTSKGQKKITVDLKLAKMIMDELGNVSRDQLPPKGPIIISEASKLKLPWYGVEFRRNWRLAADKAGVPRAVKNMDTRAGAISEATNAKSSDGDEPKLRLVK